MPFSFTALPVGTTETYHSKPPAAPPYGLRIITASSNPLGDVTRISSYEAENVSGPNLRVSHPQSKHRTKAAISTGSWRFIIFLSRRGRRGFWPSREWLGCLRSG